MLARSISQAEAREIWKRVEPRLEVDANGCWLWTGAKLRNGYGQVGRARGVAPALVHRVAWIANRDELEEGITIDHLCRVRLCANPDHLEPVSMRTNVLRGEAPTAKHARKTHCPQGHPYDRISIDKRGRRGRKCRQCHNEQERAYYQRQKEKVHAARR